MFRIGEFSKLTRVSVRMLRHYDQLGLLRPSHTDPMTKYRHYSAEQLPRLNRILALRDLGFSLEQIAGMLDEDLSHEQLLGMLRLKRAETEQAMQLGQMRLERLEARIAQMNGKGTSNKYDVVVREIEPQMVATHREVAPDDDRITFMFEGLERYVESFKARADRPPMTIYHDPEYRDENIDAEVVVPLSKEIPATDEFRVLELPPMPQAACVVHTGSYSTIYQAYNALLEWIEAHDYRMMGPIREVYLGYGADGLGFELPQTYLADGPSSYVTELQLEIEKV
jgi:DNA-binding transcriptional MerR regulator